MAMKMQHVTRYLFLLLVVCFCSFADGNEGDTFSGSGSGSGSDSDSGFLEGLNYLSFVDIDSTSGVTTYYLREYLDGVSSRIYIPGGLSFGNSIQTVAYVGTNGIISFDRPWYFWYPFPFPTPYFWTRNAYVVAPFWSDNDIRREGSVFYETHNRENPSSAEVLDAVSQFVGFQTQNSGFRGTWMLVAQWDSVHPYPHGSRYYFYFSRYYDDFVQRSNTYQAIVITDGIESYAVFTYSCNLMEWSGIWRYATVGYNAHGDYYTNHPLTGFSIVNNIACENGQQSEFNNIVYKLSLSIDVIQEAKARCRRMYLEDTQMFGDSIRQTQLSEPCPCTLWQAWRDRRFRFSFDIGYCFYQRFKRGPTLNLCCYSLRFPLWGALLTTQMSTEESSSLLLHHPVFQRDSYETYDKGFRQACCGIARLCDLFLERRPPDDCSGYDPPAWTWGRGDPHITTLDGKCYTFNGWGEYTLANTSSDFTLQGRTQPIPGNQTATQFVAFAFSDGNETVEVNCESGETCSVFRNGDNVTSSVSNMNDTFTTPTVEITRTDEGIETVFLLGATVIVNFGGGLPNFILTLPQNFQGLTQGLLGNYNGNDADEFIFRNGTMLSSDASDSMIHEFGISWQITAEESLFTYPEGQTAANYSRDNEWTPQFLDDVVNNAPTIVIEFCNDDPQCIFDYSQTGNPDVGMATLMINMNNSMDYMIATNNPPEIQGEEVFSVNVGEESIYTFNIMDDGDDDVTVGIDGGIPDNSTLEQTGNIYIFKWSLMEAANVSLVFYAIDSLNAVSVLNPRVEICACQNDGNCTRDGISSSENNVVIMNCECPPVWEGLYCENDVDGCSEITCYEGVQCFDVPAPGEGAECGPCPPGLSGDGTHCSDIDECNSTATHDCEQICRNTEGSFECDCRSGYQPEAASPNLCEDVNECALGIHRCDQVCENTEGFYTCNCFEGFIPRLDDMSACQAMEECNLNPCSQVCAVVEGEQECYCNRGFELEDDDVTCVGIDECVVYPDTCEQECMDSPQDAFECACYSGYTLDLNGRTCSDEDECLNAAQNGVTLCSEPYLCRNTLGNYSCVCPPGTEPSDSDDACIAIVEDPPPRIVVPTSTVSEPTPTPGQKGKGLSTEAKIGIAVGAGGGGIVIITVLTIGLCLSIKYANSKTTGKYPLFKSASVWPAKEKGGPEPESVPLSVSITGAFEAETLNGNTGMSAEEDK